MVIVLVLETGGRPDLTPVLLKSWRHHTKAENRERCHIASLLFSSSPLLQFWFLQSFCDIQQPAGVELFRGHEELSKWWLNLTKWLPPLMSDIMFPPAPLCGSLPHPVVLFSPPSPCMLSVRKSDFHFTIFPSATVSFWPFTSFISFSLLLDSFLN